MFLFDAFLTLRDQITEFLDLALPLKQAMLGRIRSK